MALNTLELKKYLDAGEDHSGGALVTPIRPDAFLMSNTEKIEAIRYHFAEIMHTLGLDLEDDSLKGTPHRVAKMFVEEIFAGLDPANMPKIALFDNKYQYDGMLVEKNITVHSTCEHHFLPIIGRAHVAYFSSGKVIGLSKLNRVVEYFSKRPQVQERLTNEIANHLCQVLDTEDVAVIIDAKHFCVSVRGVEDTASSTVTAAYHGRFSQQATRDELFRYLCLQPNAGF